MKTTLGNRDEIVDLVSKQVRESLKERHHTVRSGVDFLQFIEQNPGMLKDSAAAPDSSSAAAAASSPLVENSEVQRIKDLERLVIIIEDLQEGELRDTLPYLPRLNVEFVNLEVVYWKGIGDQDLQALLTALADAKYPLAALTLQSPEKDLESKVAVKLSEAIKQNPDPKFTSLSLTISMRDIGTRALVDAIKQNENFRLTNLDLSENNIGEGGVEALAELLKDPKSLLTSLNLNGNNLGDDDLIKLVSAIKENKNSRLTSLDLSNNPNIGDRGVKELAKLLANPKCPLASLTLSSTGIGDASVIAIAEAIKQNKNSRLASLTLSSTGIGDASVIAIAEAIKQNQNSRLTSLDLSNNPNIGDRGVKELAKLLAYPKCPLASFTLVNLNIKDASVIAIAEAIKQNQDSRLTSLVLRNTKIHKSHGADGVKALVEALEMPHCKVISCVVVFDFSKSPFGRQEVNEAIARRIANQSQEVSSSAASSSAASSSAAAVLPSSSPEPDSSATAGLSSGVSNGSVSQS